jgi:hypothetical protein
MDVLQTLKVVGAVLTIATGLVSLAKPLAVRKFTGLEVMGGRGITEIRAVLGGLFLGLGGAVLYINTPSAFQTLGIAYLVVGAVRAISMVIDRSIVTSNVISVIFELVFGAIFVL